MNKLLTFTDVMRELKVSRSTVYALIQRGQLKPNYVLGERLPRFEQSQIDNLMTQNNEDGK